ncbi:MAG TPA: DHHA1 domain-containing protein, partial [Bacteroidales bacterium]|nr:DHHA1 domain-containing protein [Bacteroidales bacterium]
AVAILDPKRTDCHYPYDDLSGCGVGFKLVQAYAKKKNIPFKEIEEYLDLVVISIASDIVNITGENRILAYYGLKLINTKPRPGIEAILKYSNVNKNTENNGNTSHTFFTRELTITDLVFLIGPRINASGRIENAKVSVELLICDNIDEAMSIGKCIDNTNTERKSLDSQITSQAINMIKNNELLQKSKSTVLYNPDWHKGVVGIVASRVTETFYRPTIILTNSNGLVCGSARSIKKFDIYDAISSCSEYLEHFGGHKYAAGLSLKYENLETFIKKFEQIAAETIEDEMLVPEIEIDDTLSIYEIDLKFYKKLTSFAPFGPGNMSPIFRSFKVVDNGFAKIVGGNHLRLTLVHPHIRGFPISAIAFNQGHFLEDLKKGKAFDICYHIGLNEWNGKSFLQLNIKDMKPSEENEDELY